MATISTYVIGGTGGHPSRRDVRGVYIVDCTVNFTNVAGQTAGGGDTIKLMNFPADTYIVAAGLKVTTVGTGAGTLKVSDGTNDYTTTADMTTLGEQTISAIVGKYQTAAGSINVITATASVNGTAQVWALLADAAPFETISIA